MYFGVTCIAWTGAQNPHPNPVDVSKQALGLEFFFLLVENGLPLREPHITLWPKVEPRLVIKPFDAVNLKKKQILFK